MIGAEARRSGLRVKDGCRWSRQIWSITPQTQAGGWRRGAVACGLMMALAAAVPAYAAPPAPVAHAAGKWRDASLADYRSHLKALATLVETCAKTRNIESCDPMRVGPDDRIPMGNEPHAERRLVRYGWLRVLLSQAEEPDKPQPKAAANPRAAEFAPQPTTSQLLQAAVKRLEDEVSRVSSTDGLYTQAAQHNEEHTAMQQVLAGSDFRNLDTTSAREAALEKLNNWLNRLFEAALRLRVHAPWIGLALVCGFVLAVCVALGWWMLQLERRWRMRILPEAIGSVPGTASARDFQLWMQDARDAAAKRNWREAVHFVYWAAIARLESRRLWPADRTRTPREYLALVAAHDPRKAELAKLTMSFERVWYGGQSANESDYRQAERLADSLMDGAALRPDAAAEGGAR